MTTNFEPVRTVDAAQAGTAAERNLMAFRRFIEQGFDGGDMAVVDELLAPGFREHQSGVTPPNAEGVKNLIRQLHGDLAQFHCTIVDIAAAGDRVWARLEGGGTHIGPLFGIPPTGRSVSIDIMDLCRFEDGKIVEHWGMADSLSLMRQLGALGGQAESSKGQ